MACNFRLKSLASDSVAYFLIFLAISHNVHACMSVHYTCMMHLLEYVTQMRMKIIFGIGRCAVHTSGSVFSAVYVHITNVTCPETGIRSENSYSTADSCLISQMCLTEEFLNL